VNTPLLRRVHAPTDLAESAPLLVLLHGLGSNELDLLGLAPYLNLPIRVVSLRAPFDYAGNGYAWFNIEWKSGGIAIDHVQLQESLRALITTLRELSAEFQPSRFILGGFSQGAMMTLAVLLSTPELLSGAILMSGAPLADGVTPEPLPNLELPVFIQHGIQDQVLPIRGSRLVSDLLRGLGAKVESHEYAMAHEVSSQSLGDIRAWMVELTGKRS
jgi:phospholipase/carboxylesterase